MKRAIALLGFLFGGIMMPGADMAAAADRILAPLPIRTLPFPRRAAVQSVWTSRACWNACQSACTWDLPACLQVDSQGRCLNDNDACDRTCLRGCRTRGGPYLPID